MTLLIDSTEYKKDRGLNKEDLSLIKDMGKEGLISLHIPWFVYKESSSTCIQDMQIELNKIRNDLKSLNRKGLDNSDYVKAKQAAHLVSELHDNVKASNKKLWKDFTEESKATIHEYDKEDSVEVFNSYFEGRPPFKSLKSREDIPDAFIYQTVKKLSVYNVVHVVSGDNNLTAKCQELGNVIVHKSFDELYKDENFKLIEKEYEKRKENKKIDEIKSFLIDNISDSVQDAVIDYTHNISYLPFSDKSLRSDNHEGTIYAIDDLEVTIEEDKIRFINDKFFVPIVVRGTASIDYNVFKADYWMYEEDMPTISEDLNRHYFLVEDTVPLILKKSLVFDLSEINEDETIPIKINEFDEIAIAE